MELSHNKKWRIQAVVTDIRLNSIIHITVDIAPELHVPYTIVLDDSQSQAELYALFTAMKLNLMDLLFPKTQPELCATNDRIERLDTIYLAQFASNLLVVSYLQFGIF